MLFIITSFLHLLNNASSSLSLRTSMTIVSSTIMKIVTFLIHAKSMANLSMTLMEMYLCRYWFNNCWDYWSFHSSLQNCDNVKEKCQDCRNHNNNPCGGYRDLECFVKHAPIAHFEGVSPKENCSNQCRKGKGFHKIPTFQRISTVSWSSPALEFRKNNLSKIEKKGAGLKVSFLLNSNRNEKEMLFFAQM